jgi:drug/metabolite transporter (DMT)-like permease
MLSALLGLASAIGLGTADFMARFSARALGAPLAYGVVLLVGAPEATAWLFISDARLVWSPIGSAIAVAHGFSVSAMCILLYMGIARGPIAVVVPIVAAHPALVLAINVLLGARPSAVQWAAMVTIIAASLFITRSAVSDREPSRAKTNRRTVLIAVGACLAYVAIVLTAQTATPLVGEFEILLIGRWAGLVFIGAILIVQGVPLRVPTQWIPFVGLQGALDGAGYLAFLAGAHTVASYVTVVVASAFSVVTVLLARLIIHEPVSKSQWTAIALVATGTAVLSAT